MSPSPRLHVLLTLRLLMHLRYAHFLHRDLYSIREQTAETDLVIFDRI